MIDRELIHKFHNHGIQLDMTGIPIKAGDTVLTKNYCSATLGTVTKVVKVTNKAVYVELTARRWKPFLKSSVHHGYLNASRHGRWVTETFPVRRCGSDMLIIDNHLNNRMAQATSKLKEEHPEVFL